VPPPTLDRDFLWAILDQLAHPVFVKDREFRYVFLNQAALAVVDRSLESLVGQTDEALFPGEKATFYRERDSEVFTTGGEVTVDEEVMIDSTGKRRVLATTKVPFRDASGAVTHLVGVIQDITQLKTAEAALRAANEELERRVAERTRELAEAQGELLRKERLAVLGRLVGGLAHEIRNPLGAIINATAILERSGPAAPTDASRAIEIIREEGWRANRIIVDLLDYARVRPPEPGLVRVDKLINQVLLRQEIPDAIAVELEVPPGLTVMADSDQSESALRNVVRNAVEAMPTGGTLRVSAQQSGAGLVLAVSDTGPGIPEEVRDRLFEPLVTTKSLGLGLGLSTARALIENQGGTLIVAHSEGGARFELRLPGVLSG
jgi:PAS domain S-box-containing protein